jgi:hypothetical protein
MRLKSLLRSALVALPLLGAACVPEVYVPGPRHVYYAPPPAVYVRPPVYVRPAPVYVRPYSVVVAPPRARLWW